MSEKRMPQGKGFFVEGLTPDNMAQRSSWLGGTWLMLQTVSMEGKIKNSTSALTDFSGKLREAGIDIWLWGWPQPDAIDSFAKHLSEVMQATAASGYILDMEKVWREGQKAQAAQLVEAVRQASDQSIGLSSYGGPRFHPNYPWEELSALDFGMPQIYDKDNKYGDEFPQRCVDGWKSWFKDRPIIPTLGANSTAATRMQVIFQNTPFEAACSWWSFRGVIASGEKAQSVRDFQVPRALV